MNITRIVTDYIATPDISGALFINGEWGIGKSYYWRNKIVPTIEALTNPDTRKNYKCLYVSLNGLTDPNEIYNQLLYAKIPWADSKAMKITKSTGMGGLKLFGSLTGAKWLSDSLTTIASKSIGLDQLLNFKDNVLCFDDLERNNIQDQLLGFINTRFIEQANIRTIIIGNEAEIEQGKNYHKIKEKLIFRSLQFDKELVGLPEILNRYNKQPAYQSFLKTNAAYIRQILDNASEKNLRTLIFALDCMRAIYESDHLLAEEKYEELSRSLLLFTLLISFEFKKGLLKTGDYNNYKNLDQLSDEEFKIMLVHTMKKLKPTGLSAKEDEGKVEAPSYETDFYNRYDLRNRKEFYFFPSVYRYVLSGDLDQPNMKKEFLGFEDFVEKRDHQESPQLSAFRYIQQPYWVEDQKVFEENKEAFFQFLKNGDYLFLEYGSFYEMLCQLSDLEVIPETKEALKAMVTEGLHKSIMKHTAPLNEFILSQAQMMKSHDPEITALIDKKKKELEQTKQHHQIDQYFEDMKGDPKLFIQQYAVFDPFKYIGAAEFHLRLQGFPFQGYRNLYSYLDRQLHVSNLKEFYVQNIPALQELNALLTKEIQTVSGGLYKYHLKMITQHLDALVTSLQ